MRASTCPFLGLCILIQKGRNRKWGLFFFLFILFSFHTLSLSPGGELFDRIPLGCGTTEETARRYVGQLLSGVAYCHRRGVCHRDIKPENLLLDEQLNLKVRLVFRHTGFMDIWSGCACLSCPSLLWH